MAFQSVSVQTLGRLPLYLNFLKSLSKDQAVNISATTIAAALCLNDVQVRKDLALVSKGGRPKIGYVTTDLILDIEQFLGYDNTDSAVVVGAGNLGRSLLCYEEFAAYGMNIIAAFDVDVSLIGSSVNQKLVMSYDKMKDLCKRMNVRIGIITVPAIVAQSVCDSLIESGVSAIWNFAPTHLNVPETVLLKNENLACSLAVLSKNLSEKLYGNRA